VYFGRGSHVVVAFIADRVGLAQLIVREVQCQAAGKKRVADPLCVLVRPFQLLVAASDRLRHPGQPVRAGQLAQQSDSALCFFLF